VQWDMKLVAPQASKRCMFIRAASEGFAQPRFKETQAGLQHTDRVARTHQSLKPGGSNTELKRPLLCHVGRNMDAIHFFRRLYSLDTLDTRLTTSSYTPLTVASSEPPGKSTSERGRDTDAANLPPGASPSRWRTKEFYIYYAVFIFVVPQMFKAVMDVSLRALLSSRSIESI
jgi:hypothetical protein